MRPVETAGVLLSVSLLAGDLPAARAQTPLVPPTNDFCSAPSTLVLDTPVDGTTAEGKNDYQTPSGCYAGVGQVASSAAGRDVVYRFTAPTAGNYSWRVTGYPSTADALIFVASSCPTTGTPPITVTTCLGASNRTTSAGAEEAVCLPLAAGQTVYAYVDEHAPSSGGGPFTIEVNRCAREAESNDLPGTAVARSCPSVGSISPAGEVDFYRLGAPASGSRVFALADGVAANAPDFDLRVTTSTDTREYDDADNDAPFGATAPNVAGTPLTGTPSYLRVNHRSVPAIAAEPYRLYAAVQPGFTSATLESEPNETTATANAAANRYFRGTISTMSDVDHFKIDAVAGELIVLGLDADPQRNNTPGNLALALLDPAGAVLAAVNDPDTSSDVTSGAGSLTALTPRSPAEGIVYRARTTGTHYARVSGASGIDYLLSSAINCKVFPATDLLLGLSAAPACVVSGQPLSYLATITNSGPAAARNVILTDPLPSGVSFVSAVPSQGTCQGGATVLCQLGDLPASSSATVTINVTATTASSITNTARVESDVADTSAANDAATVITNGPCNDGSVCTTSDACAAGVCVGGPPLDCSDTNPCTDDLCLPGTGCQHPFNALPCDDGNACSSGDLCRAGVCTAGACHGTCPESGKECVQTESDACLCLDGPAACGGTAPMCAGACPTGTLCTSHGTGTACVCEPPPTCGASAPQCGGLCPTGTRCEPTTTPTPGCACLPAELPCESSGSPTCGGACDVGYTCTADGGACRCTPSLPSCGGAAAPRCAGSCGAHAYCRPSPSGGCGCAALDLTCGGAAAPACNGRCGDDERCSPGSGTGCLCVPDPCGSSTYPTCGGACPTGSVCRTDASQLACVCEPDLPTSCAASSAPQCGGSCPAGYSCETNLDGSSCQCEPERVPCTSAGFPTCAGECAGDDVCTSGTGGCFCAPPVIDCGQGTAPACNGNCPGGQRCGPAILGGGCECSDPDPPCGDARAPVCNGDCPPATQCLPAGSAGTCSCQGCNGVPPGPAITMLWSSRVRIEWSVARCATSYNLYRRSGGFVDADRNGAADHYGTCLHAGLVEPFTIDTTTPSPGSFFSYLVTGESAAGEGPLGYSSADVLRPNVAACP